MNKQEWKEWLEKQEPPFEVNKWGSCQYSTAKWFYDTFNAMIDDEITYNDALKLLGCRVSYTKIETFDALKDGLIETLDDRIVDNIEEGDYDDIIETVKFIKRLQSLTTVDEVFYLLKDMSWDLWSAADYVAHQLFTNLIVEAPKSPGYGPALNQAVQSGNFETGLYCALLVHFGLVQNSEAFAGFDT